MLTPRQQINVLCVLQLHRITALVSQQTPQALHRLPAASLISGVPPPRDLGEERSARPVKQVHRANRRDWHELKPSERRRQAYNKSYYAATRGRRRAAVQPDLWALSGEES